MTIYKERRIHEDAKAAIDYADEHPELSLWELSGNGPVAVYLTGAADYVPNMRGFRARKLR